MSSYKIIIGGVEIDATSSSMGVDVYNLTADVIRVTKTRTSRGQTEVPVTVVSGLPCDILWLKGKEMIKFNKDTHTLDGILKCRVPSGVNILVSDRILYNGDTYEITNIYDVRNLGVLLEIAIKKDN